MSDVPQHNVETSGLDMTIGCTPISGPRVPGNERQITFRNYTTIQNQRGPNCDCCWKWWEKVVAVEDMTNVTNISKSCRSVSGWSLAHLLLSEVTYKELTGQSFLGQWSSEKCELVVPKTPFVCAQNHSTVFGVVLNDLIQAVGLPSTTKKRLTTLKDVFGLEHRRCIFPNAKVEGRAVSIIPIDLIPEFLNVFDGDPRAAQVVINLGRVAPLQIASSNIGGPNLVRLCILQAKIESLMKQRSGSFSGLAQEVMGLGDNMETLVDTVSALQEENRRVGEENMQQKAMIRSLHAKIAGFTSMVDGMASSIRVLGAAMGFSPNLHLANPDSLQRPQADPQLAFLNTLHDIAEMTGVKNPSLSHIEKSFFKFVDKKTGVTRKRKGDEEGKKGRKKKRSKTLERRKSAAT